MELKSAIIFSLMLTLSSASLPEDLFRSRRFIIESAVPNAEAIKALTDMAHYHRYHWIALKIVGDEVVVDAAHSRVASPPSWTCASDALLEEMKHLDMPASEPRFVVFHGCFDRDGDKQGAPILDLWDWSPDSARTKTKMQYSSTSAALVQTMKDNRLLCQFRGDL
ncbi:uncharacterized protein [Amphiura filiformis]|uniref:uncharacterized protein n=1 Tax=Amphiura filiformis TaxID=82378 RepID=UPI003B20FF3F